MTISVVRMFPFQNDYHVGKKRRRGGVVCVCLCVSVYMCMSKYVITLCAKCVLTRNTRVRVYRVHNLSFREGVWGWGGGACM